MRLAEVKALGFDLSVRSGKYVRPMCSQCQAVVVNGTACHEFSCPNATKECKGCNARIAAYPVWVKYCGDCQE